MVQSVELLLDPALDASIREQWQALLDAGLPSQARHTGAANAPHLTLAVVEQPLPPAVDVVVADALVQPLPVRLDGLLLFGTGPYVLVRAVVPSQRLLDLPAAPTTELRELPNPTGITAPRAWSPHVTLAHRVQRSLVPDALAVLATFEGTTGHADRGRCWDSVTRRDRAIGIPLDAPGAA